MRSCQIFSGLESGGASNRNTNMNAMMNKSGTGVAEMGKSKAQNAYREIPVRFLPLVVIWRLVFLFNGKTESTALEEDEQDQQDDGNRPAADHGPEHGLLCHRGRVFFKFHGVDDGCAVFVNL